MASCYNGAILHVDLTANKLWVENPAEQFYRTYGGGSAMGLYYILGEMPAGVDALSPENVLTFFTGVPTGLAISGQSRLCANARSPLTNAIGDSQCGGFFPAALKFAGFDGIVVRGQAEHPVYLWLHDGQAELRDAGHLWGKTTAEVDEALKQEYNDPKLEILQIGPAGEKLVRTAAILNMCNRANGRTGLGAVMGSKLLKAVVVQGKRKMQAVDAQALGALARAGAKDVDNNGDVKGLAVEGTSSVVVFQNLYGSFPTRNYNEGQFEHYEQLSGERLSADLLKETDTCYACSVRCKRVVEAEWQGRAVERRYGGPEYETIGTFGAYCGVANLKAVAMANQLCNTYGLDTIGTGATIAFAMECFENGLIGPADTDGLELRFGNAEAMVAMVERIGMRQGFGDVLAEGSARAAQRIGQNASDFLITAKGAEAPAHMPQAKKTLGLIYAVNPFGADHQSSEHDPMYEEGAADLYLQRLGLLGLNELQPVYSLTDEKVRFAYLGEVFYSALDSYALCQFVWGPAWTLYGPQELVQLLQAATGWDVTLAEVMQVGERRLNLLRAFNAREGFTRQDDRLTKKFFKPLAGTGPTAGVALDEAQLEHCKDVYYRLAGWDVQSGNPTPQKLAELGLEWTVG